MQWLTAAITAITCGLAPPTPHSDRFGMLALPPHTTTRPNRALQAAQAEVHWACHPGNQGKEAV